MREIDLMASPEWADLSIFTLPIGAMTAGLGYEVVGVVMVLLPVILAIVDRR